MAAGWWRRPRFTARAIIEHILAVAMLLQIERQRCNQLTGIAHEHVHGLPTRTAADTAAALEREQERVLGEGVVITRERIPFIGRDLGQLRSEVDAHGLVNPTPETGLRLATSVCQSGV